MFLLTNDKQYYNFEKEQWENDYKLATVLVLKGSKHDGEEFRWVIVEFLYFGFSTLILDKQTGILTEMMYYVDAISRIESENSRQRIDRNV